MDKYVLIDNICQLLVGSNIVAREKDEYFKNCNKIAIFFIENYSYFVCVETGESTKINN